MVCVGPLSQWSKEGVANWLQEQQSINDLNFFDVESVSAKGEFFADFSMDDMTKRAGGHVGMEIFLLKEKLLLKEACPDFRINNYEVKHLEILGSSHAVLNFGESKKVDPPFMIVHPNILNQLEEWVKHATKEDRREKTVCVINGLVKTGKTAALKYVLPSLVRQYEPDAEFCHLDFEKFMTPGSHRHAIAKDLLSELQAWARVKDFRVKKFPDDTYSDTKRGLLKIMDSFRKTGRKIYFLFDEVQRFFQVDGNPDHVLFKALLNVGHSNGGIRFAFTGSGMVRAWTEIAKCPANGTSVGASSCCINLPPTDPLPVLDYTNKLLLRHYKVDGSSDIDKLLSTMPSVAGRSYVLQQWTMNNVQDDSEAWVDVSFKFQDEFQADMLPLLAQMESSDRTQDLLRLRELAQGTATEDPQSWCPANLYHYFFRHYKLLVISFYCVTLCCLELH